MSRRSVKPLFNSIEVFRVIEGQKQRFKDAFAQVSDAELIRHAAGVSARLVGEFSMNVPVLDVEHKYAVPKEVQVEVSRDPRRLFSDRSQPHYVSGTEITIVVPFQGDEAVFDVQPTSFTLSPPIAEVHDGQIHLVYALTDADAAFDVEAAAGKTIGEIQQYLDNLRHSAEQLKLELQQLATALVEKRRQARGTHSQIVAGLKMPVVTPPPLKPVPEFPQRLGFPAVTRHKSSAKPEGSWDVFISHATEDKDEIARPLAEALRGKGVRVWYDEFALSLGDSLRRSIDRGIANSRFGVVILSPNFFEKHWPQQELNGLATREVQGGKVILPIWHRVGFAEVAASSPTLADKLAVSSDKGVDYVVERILLAMK